MPKKVMSNGVLISRKDLADIESDFDKAACMNAYRFYINLLEPFGVPMDFEDFKNLFYSNQFNEQLRRIAYNLVLVSGHEVYIGK